jgi:ribosomal-protein-alanine N-acetyltransferase
MLELNFSPFPSLHTSRLHLREVSLNDAEAMFLIRANKDAMRFVGKPLAKTIADAEELLGRMIEGVKNNEGLTWGITFKDNEKLIGTIGFWRIDKDHYRTEIGYMLHPDHWRKGIISEAMDAVIDFAFRELKFHSIEAQLTPENVGSVKVLEKAGFTKEGHFKENYFFEGKFSDTAVYSKLNPDH